MARTGGSRFLDARVALFWLGAGVWLVGILLQLDVLTGVAIAILVAAMALGLIAKRSAEEDPETDEEEDPDL